MAERREVDASNNQIPTSGRKGETLEELGIPTPSNAREEDTEFYSKAGISRGGKGQKLMFEPPAELVDLPSHGYLYHGVTEDSDILEKGAIRIRPMTVNEEKILSTPRIVRAGQALDMIFQNCIKSDIDPSELLSSDRVYLMLWLRSVSYGNIYRFKLTCPDTGREFETEVDLSEHPIREMDDPEIKEPFETILPVSKFKVWFRLPRGKDELEIIKLQNKPKKMDSVDETVVHRLKSAILKIQDPSGETIPENIKEQFVESLIARDASHIRNKMEDFDSGIEDIQVTSPYSDREYSVPIPITENFFRSTE